MDERRCTICSARLYPDQLSRCSHCLDYAPFPVVAGGQGRTADDVAETAMSWAELATWCFATLLLVSVAAWVIGGAA